MQNLLNLIPKQTSPLTKFIRTTEGWLVVGANVALIVTPIVSNALSASKAATLGIILNGVTVVSRSVLKAITSLSPILGAPIDPNLSGAPAQLPPGPPIGASGISAAELEQGPPALTDSDDTASTDVWRQSHYPPNAQPTVGIDPAGTLTAPTPASPPVPPGAGNVA